MPIFSLVREWFLKEGWLSLTNNTANIRQILAVGISLIISGLLAEFSFRVIETPLRKVGRRLTEYNI